MTRRFLNVAEFSKGLPTNTSRDVLAAIAVDGAGWSNVPMQLRTASPNDAREICAIYAPSVEGSAVSFEERVPTEDEMRERIAKIAAEYPYLVAVDGDRVVGYAYASKFRERAAYRWTTEVSAYVHQDFHGRGVGRALYARLFEILKERKFSRAIAGIALPNDASVAFHESMGFEHAGTFAKVGFKLNQWWDVGFWQREI